MHEEDERATWVPAGAGRWELARRKKDGGQTIGLVERVSTLTYTWRAHCRRALISDVASTEYAAKLAVRAALRKHSGIATLDSMTPEA